MSLRECRVKQVSLSLVHTLSLPPSLLPSHPHKHTLCPSLVSSPILSLSLSHLSLDPHLHTLALRTFVHTQPDEVDALAYDQCSLCEGSREEGGQHGGTHVVRVEPHVPNAAWLTRGCLAADKEFLAAVVQFTMQHPSKSCRCHHDAR